MVLLELDKLVLTTYMGNLSKQIVNHCRERHKEQGHIVFPKIEDIDTQVTAVPQI